MRGHRDLERVSVAAVVCALVAALVPLEVVRLAAALPLTLFLPGYAIVAAAFASRELAPPKRLTLSVGVSLMVLVLSAFVLNIPPFGLRTASWAVLLPLVVIAAARGAALRRHEPRSGRSPWGGIARPSAGSVALVALALVIGVAALVLADRPLPAKNVEGFSALWMLPTDSSDEEVVVGVISNEQDPTAYRLEVTEGKDEPQVFRFSLDPGEEKTFELSTPPRGASRIDVAASLYREQRPQKLYRRVTSWLPRQNSFP